MRAKRPVSRVSPVAGFPRPVPRVSRAARETSRFNLLNCSRLGHGIGEFRMAFLLRFIRRGLAPETYAEAPHGGASARHRRTQGIEILTPVRLRRGCLSPPWPRFRLLWKRQHGIFRVEEGDLACPRICDELSSSVQVLAARRIIEVDAGGPFDFRKAPIENAIKDGAIGEAKLAHNARI